MLLLVDLANLQSFAFERRKAITHVCQKRDFYLTKMQRCWHYPCTIKPNTKYQDKTAAPLAQPMQQYQAFPAQFKI